MKQYFLFLLGALCCLYTVAQDEKTITGTNKIAKNLTPKQVIDSLESRFPDAKSVEYFKTTPDLAARGWAIDVEDNIQSDEAVDYYTIKFKRQDFQYYGLYKPDGTLVMSKYKATIDSIPESIRVQIKGLSEKYPGYKVIEKTYLKNTNHSNSKEYYEFVATNGKEKKKVIFDGAGTLVKVK